MATYRVITKCAVGKRQGMARNLSEILPDLLNDGYPIKAETRNIEYLSAKTKYYQNKKGVSSLARYVGQEGYTLLYIYCDASLEDAYASFFL